MSNLAVELDRIEAEMRRQVEYEMGDPEASHGSADDLLMELATLLARFTSKPEQVERILTAYRKVGKWYA